MTQLQRPSIDMHKHTLSAEYLHDLRTPLNHIIGYSEMLTEQAKEEGQSGFLPDLQNIHTAARLLLTLLNTGIPSLPNKELQDSRPKIAITPDALPPELRPGPATEQSTPGAVPSLILVVDDNRANREVLSRRLERQGYIVAMAEDGRQAMDAMRTRAFDLVLLDIMMPEMDGYAVLKEIKGDEALCHIPVIMISALDELDKVVRCIGMGAEDYLPKPFEPTLLKARIGSCLEKKRARDREMHLFKQMQENFKHLQELEQQRDDLTNMIIHDLRTPLTSILTGMQTLGLSGGLDELQQEMVDVSISGGETLLCMVNDLLDVEKMESRTMQLDYAELDAAELVDSAIGQVASLAETKNLTVKTQISPDLPSFGGDENKLRRVLVNLLGNAIKFTPADGTLTLKARLGEAKQELVFSVSDTGEGIPVEACERIFEKFGQVESRQGGRTMSTGLGLTFCKLVVEAHGGGIHVDSMPGNGSTFTFAIPFTADAPVLGAKSQELVSA